MRIMLSKNFLISKSLVILMLSVFIFTPASGQLSSSANQQSMNENSPYNRFGIGLLEEIASGAIRAMGGGGNGFSDEISSNVSNPASYGFMLSTTLDGGFATKQRSVAFENSLSVSSLTGTLSHLHLVVPVKKLGALAVGFQPISNTYYKSVDSGTIGTDIIAKTYNGNGGLNQFFAGISGKYKSLSIGVNAAYIFGSINHHNYISSYGLSSLRSYRSREETRYNGWNLKLGAMYSWKINPKNKLNIGATITPSQSLRGSKNILSTAMNEVISANGNLMTVNIDTMAFEDGMKGSLVLPSIYGFGMHYSYSDKSEVLADVEYKDWSKFRNFGNIDSIAESSFRFSLGGSFTPNANSIYTLSKGNYFSAITYRYGFYYAQDYLNLRNNQFNDYGGTFGLSFPLKRSSGTNQLGKIHTAVAFGQRGTFTNGLAKENYFRFTISASLNDVWFIKPKYD